ncbi:MAG: hypothetical protein HY781_11465 [Chloroflexi bacterium]|nr:hypothetical protein [Chloroflexota bacterium]
MKTPVSILLLLASLSAFLVALLHVAIVFIGRKGYGYFGAAQLIPLVDKGSPWPAVITFALAGIFAVCGLYGLSGAGFLPHLPLLRLGLIVIGAVFTLRGLALVREIPKVIRHSAALPGRELVFSSVSLIVGLFYLTGILLGWRELV